MGRHPAFRLVACAAGLLAAACDVDYDDPSYDPASYPAWVSIDATATKVNTQTMDLRGEAECDGCPPPTGWEPGHCPAIECPTSTGVEVTWRNQTTGATGAAMQFIGSRCHCPILFYGYCYSACYHVWQATVSLGFGENVLEVAATAPGFAQGTATRTIERVPNAPEWLPPEVGPGEITLSWTAVPGATSYNLYWSAPWAYWTLAEKIEGVSSPYTHTGLASGLTHYYYVTALSGTSESFDPLMVSTAPL